jgi:hypothetical protein
MNDSYVFFLNGIENFTRNSDLVHLNNVVLRNNLNHTCKFKRNEAVFDKDISREYKKRNNYNIYP